jgi:peptidoglycan/xylan/chitin deacetylase (PgdA/CDA1 family)
MAITFNGLPHQWPQPDLTLNRINIATVKLINLINENRVPVVAFVNERELIKTGELDRRLALLSLWTDEDMELGNGTYANRNLPDTTLQGFMVDIVLGNNLTRLLAAEARKPVRYVRFPGNYMGATAAQRAELLRYIAALGLAPAPVTIDLRDDTFGAAYSFYKTHGNKRKMDEVAEAFLAYAAKSLQYHEALSQQVLGRQVAHVLQLHANELHADYFSQLAKLLRGRGYAFVPLEKALADEAYAALRPTEQAPDTYTGPDGVTWLYRLARSKGIAANPVDAPPLPDVTLHEADKQAKPR